MTKKEEKEAYEWYQDRLSAPSHPILLSKDECDAYNAEHPLPSKEDIERILKGAVENETNTANVAKTNER